jgi:hypothetical protein
VENLAENERMVGPLVHDFLTTKPVAKFASAASALPDRLGKPLAAVQLIARIPRS